MTPNVCSYASKLLTVCFLLIAASTYGQRTMKPKLPNSDYKKFLKTQWWLGMRVGTTLSGPSAKETFSSIDPIDYEVEDLSKTYSKYKNPGVLIGLDLTFYHRGVSAGIQPTFKQLIYGYSSLLQWEGTTPEQTFESSYDSKQKLNYLDIPFILKFDILTDGKIRPFVGGGVNYAFNIGAEKETSIVNTDNTSGTPRSYDAGNFVVNNQDQFKNFFGMKFGGGVSFDYFNIRTAIDVFYNLGFTNVSDENARYELNELTTLGDVNDDLNLNHLSVAVSFLFPLRYIDNTFQPY
ncbi:outer membrane beta-barrel protein [Reichenbachiella versicolor]|uniref:outer membrane beta-barrel protein n=1 Tax=Reichenbachiella versicolor TaxID=1821036 RepID=UPI000D6E3EA7|nr:outer membrane beta-barrel protein [Reichenbachiella versicolor]